MAGGTIAGCSRSGSRVGQARRSPTRTTTGDGRRTEALGSRGSPDPAAAGTEGLRDSGDLRSAVGGSVGDRPQHDGRRTTDGSTGFGAGLPTPPRLGPKVSGIRETFGRRWVARSETGHNTTGDGRRTEALGSARVSRPRRGWDRGFPGFGRPSVGGGWLGRRPATTRGGWLGRRPATTRGGWLGRRPATRRRPTTTPGLTSRSIGKDRRTPRGQLAEDHFGLWANGQHAVADGGDPSGEQLDLAGIAVHDVGRSYAGKRRGHGGGRKQRADVLALPHPDGEGQEGIGLLLAQADGQDVAAGGDPAADGIGMGRQSRACTGSHGSHNQDLVGPGTAASIGCRGQPHLLQVFAAGLLADVAHLAGGRRRVGRNVVQYIGDQPGGGRIVLAACGHVHLAEQDEALPLAIHHERAELEAEAAVDDGQEVSAGGFFDQHGGHVPPVAGPVGPRGLDAAPLDGGAKIGLHRVMGQPRRQDRGLAAPVAKAVGVEPGEQRMIGHAGEDSSQTVLLDTKAETLLQHVGRLLEHDHLQPPADAGDVGRRTVDRQGGLADDQHAVAAQVGIGGDRIISNAHPGEQPGGFALGIEQGRLGGRRGRFGGARTLTANVSSWVSPELKRAVSVS